MDLGLANRVVLITGAGGGVGPTLASAFAAEGAAVALHQRDAAKLGRAHEAADSIRSGGGRAIVVGADLRATDAIQSMVARVGDELGPVSVLVNATSAYRAEGLLEIGDDSWAAMVEDMLGATFRVSRAVAPAMRAAKWGRIVSFASRSALAGVARAPHYAAAKAGVIGLTSSLAKELGPDGILVNAVAPTQILTVKDGVPSIPDERAGKMARSIPLRRLATPDDVSGLVVWLASAANTYVTGETIPFTGGAKT
ncbi:MAG: SDR family oxidoreductase [Chloroflexi bacterium]|nr:SDR family oxidoreductase [Chloroflexota bacterium]